MPSSGQNGLRRLVSRAVREPRRTSALSTPSGTGESDDGAAEDRRDGTIRGYTIAMPSTTRTVGIVLILLGLVSYFGTGRISVTALIPAFFGAVFVRTK